MIDLHRHKRRPRLLEDTNRFSLSSIDAFTPQSPYCPGVLPSMYKIWPTLCTSKSDGKENDSILQSWNDKLKLTATIHSYQIENILAETNSTRLLLSVYTSFQDYLLVLGRDNNFKRGYHFKFFFDLHTLGCHQLQMHLYPFCILTKHHWGYNGKYATLRLEF